MRGRERERTLQIYTEAKLHNVQFLNRVYTYKASFHVGELQNGQVKSRLHFPLYMQTN